MKLKRIIQRIIIICLCLAFAGGIFLLSVNAYVKSSVKDNIVSPDDAATLEGVDCIIVLGCLVKGNGDPSDMLEDRLKRGIELYYLGASLKLLMSGDHGREEYDEVSVMKRYAIEAGIGSSDIFMDHAGFSTYDSIYRAKEVFGADKIIIVTQEYHLYRALYIADALGVEAYGVSSDLRSYRNQSVRDIREILARNKDWFFTIFKPEPKYLGDPISLEVSGDVTND